MVVTWVWGCVLYCFSGIFRKYLKIYLKKYIKHIKQIFKKYLKNVKLILKKYWNGCDLDMRLCPLGYNIYRCSEIACIYISKTASFAFIAFTYLSRALLHPDTSACEIWSCLCLCLICCNKIFTKSTFFLCRGEGAPNTSVSTCSTLLW